VFCLDLSFACVLVEQSAIAQEKKRERRSVFIDAKREIQETRELCQKLDRNCECRPLVFFLSLSALLVSLSPTIDSTRLLPSPFSSRYAPRSATPRISLLDFVRHGLPLVLDTSG
jgi:hypothetical protein